MILKPYKRPKNPEMYFELRESQFGVQLVLVNAGGRILYPILTLTQQGGKIALKRHGGLNKHLFHAGAAGMVLDWTSTVLGVGSKPSSSKPESEQTIEKPEEEKKGKENGVT